MACKNIYWMTGPKKFEKHCVAETSQRKTHYLIPIEDTQPFGFFVTLFIYLAFE